MCLSTEICPHNQCISAQVTGVCSVNILTIIFKMFCTKFLLCQYYKHVTACATLSHNKQEVCLVMGIKKKTLSTATKEMDNPEDTAEKVGISALIVQVNYYEIQI